MLSLNVIRKDVEGALDRYVALTPDTRGSVIGRLAINESRVDMELSRAQMRIRAAAWQPAECRVFASVNHLGEIVSIATVAPRDVNLEPIVARSGRRGAATQNTILLDWRGTIGQKLKKIEPQYEDALVFGADLRSDLQNLRAQIRDLNHQLGSPSRSQSIRHRRAAVQASRDAAKAREEAVRRRWQSLAQTDGYEQSLILFWLVCNDDADTLAYCLGK